MRGGFNDRGRGGPMRDNRECFYCHRMGHLVGDCRTKMYHEQQRPRWGVRNTHSTQPKHSSNPQHPQAQNMNAPPWATPQGGQSGALSSQQARMDGPNTWQGQQSTGSPSQTLARGPVSPNPQGGATVWGGRTLFQPQNLYHAQ